MILFSGFTPSETNGRPPILYHQPAKSSCSEFSLASLKLLQQQTHLNRFISIPLLFPPSPSPSPFLLLHIRFESALPFFVPSLIVLVPLQRNKTKQSRYPRVHESPIRGSESTFLDPPDTNIYLLRHFNHISITILIESFIATEYSTYLQALSSPSQTSNTDLPVHLHTSSSPCYRGLSSGCSPSSHYYSPSHKHLGSIK